MFRSKSFFLHMNENIRDMMPQIATLSVKNP